MRTATLLAAAYFFCIAAYAEVRTALVIGNSAYLHQFALRNARPDAKAIGRALRTLGFEVVEGYDLDRSRMVAKLRGFGRVIESSDIAVFYYAGHAIQSGGINYIVPVDARLESRLDFSTELLAFDVFADELKKAIRLNVAILDACRDSPEMRGLLFETPTRAFSIRRGLAPIYNQAPESLVAYSTSPGQVASDGDGSHSPYAAALLRHLDEPGVDIRRMFGYVRDTVLVLTDGRQEPWVHTSLGGKLWSFAPAPTTEKTGNDQREEQILSPVVRPRLTEMTSGQKARQPTTREAPRTAGELPDQLLQYALKDLGYYSGALDGLIGKQTREAIRAFQANHSLPTTGTLNDSQIVTLIRDAANAGYPDSQNTMGMMAAAGIGIPVDLDLAHSSFQASADQANSYALYNLGAMYRDGVGVEPSLEKAKKLFEQGAELGNASARTALNELQAQGI